MGLPELLEALEREVDRQVREMNERAEAEGRRLLDAVRGEISEAHRAELERARARLDDESARARSRLRIERARKILTMKRELLAMLRLEVEKRAKVLDPRALLPRLVDEIISDADGGGPIRLRVEAKSAELLRRELEARHRAVADRIEIEAVKGMSPGVELVKDDEVIDNTLPSRLRKLWPSVEGEVATLLFGEDRDRRV